MGKKEETEGIIIQKALELFVRNGYHGTSINDIMKKVGLTKGALYAHFTSKGELLLRIIDRFKTEYIDELIKAGNECEGNALEKFHRIISFSTGFAIENQDMCVFLTFLTTELNADVDFEPPLKNLYREFQKYISSLIRVGMSQGFFDKDLDPDLAALSYMAIHDGILHQWVLNRNYIVGEQLVSTFRRIFLYGLVSSDVSRPSYKEQRKKESSRIGKRIFRKKNNE